MVPNQNILTLLCSLFKALHKTEKIEKRTCRPCCRVHLNLLSSNAALKGCVIILKRKIRFYFHLFLQTWWNLTIKRKFLSALCQVRSKYNHKIHRYASYVHQNQQSVKCRGKFVDYQNHLL